MEKDELLELVCDGLILAFYLYLKAKGELDEYLEDNIGDNSITR